MFGLFGCGNAKYRVDYCGQKGDFPGAKDAYAAGKNVTLYFPYIATDTDYSFFLDEERLNPGYEEGKGFVLKFTMPDRDVKLTVRSVNSMTAPEPETTAPAQKEAVLSYHSFEGGGPEYRVTVDDPQIVKCTETRTYSDPDHEKIDGAGYTENFAFQGLKSGTTTITVAARSPIAESFDETYRANVDDELNITLTLLKRTEGDDAVVLEPEPVL